MSALILCIALIFSMPVFGQTAAALPYPEISNLETSDVFLVSTVLRLPTHAKLLRQMILPLI